MRIKYTINLTDSRNVDNTNVLWRVRFFHSDRSRISVNSGLISNVFMSKKSVIKEFFHTFVWSTRCEPKTDFVPGQNANKLGV